MPGVFYVYVVANKRRGKTYIGLTSNLVQRVNDHRNGLVEDFTTKHGISKLVYFEKYDDVEIASAQEKKYKEYKSKWITELVEKRNPEWKDLHEAAP